MSKCASDGVRDKVEYMSDIAAHQRQYHTVSTSHCSESLSLAHSLTHSLTRTLPLGGIFSSTPAVARMSQSKRSSEKTGSGLPFSAPPPCHSSSGVDTRMLLLDWDNIRDKDRDRDRDRRKREKCDGTVLVLSLISGTSINNQGGSK